MTTLRVTGELEAALDPAVLRSLDSATLLGFLSSRRWFGGKGSGPHDAHITHVVPLADGALRAAVARVDVTFDGGRIAHHQLPLAACAANESAAAPLPPSTLPRLRGALARVDAGKLAGLLVDATELPAFRAALGGWLATGCAFAGEDARWTVEALGDLDARALAAEPARVIASEQSNTSIVYGDVAILKLFRRFEPGEHPDVEMTSFLTLHAGFANTPRLLGTIHIETAGERSVAGMLQRYIAGATDAWSYTLDALSQTLRAPADREPANSESASALTSAFTTDAASLGAITRALHEALASRPGDADFAPELAGATDVAAWATATRASVEAGFDHLAEALDAKRVAERDTPAATAILRRREATHARVSELVAHVGGDAGARIRHHGDYHLGQLLRAPDGDFFVIDFEGEPTRPLTERRRRQSPLRDVAGMARSFAYAAASGAIEAAGGAPNALVEIRAGRWERDVRAAFLDAYFAVPSGGASRNGAFREEAPTGALTRILPEQRASAEHLIALFEIEKVFYELSYELDHRPDWVAIPLRGIAKLF